MKKLGSYELTFAQQYDALTQEEKDYVSNLEVTKQLIKEIDEETIRSITEGLEDGVEKR